MRHERADELEAALNAGGVGARGYYRTPLHRQPAMAPWAPAGLDLPVTDELARTHLAIPMNPLLDRAAADEVVAAVREGLSDERRAAERPCASGSTSPTPRTCSCMRPVIDVLRADGHEVHVTARDFAQTLALCERFGIDAQAIGHHRGGRLAAKGLGLAQRSARSCAGRAGKARSTSRSATAPTTSRSPPRCCGSRARRRSTTSGRPSSTPSTADSRRRSSCRDAIPPERLRATARGRSSTSYPGLKEEYYLADFEPDPAVLDELALDPAQPIVVVRTPPAVSLYHRFENDTFGAVLQQLRDEGAQAVVLPRTPEQRAELTQAGGFIVPERAIDAQSLIAYADLVISAGGTMNREAVALGTPVFTTFEGRLGAVDEQLIADGRLKLLRDPAEVVVAKRAPAATGQPDRIRRDPRDFTRLLSAPATRL